eukprot:4824539-Ditylum_brightwellii.AAC.1
MKWANVSHHLESAKEFQSYLMEENESGSLTADETQITQEERGSHSFIRAKLIPPGVSPQLLEEGRRKMQTMAGNFSTNQKVDLREILLPELDRAKRIDGIIAHIPMKPVVQWKRGKMMAVDDYLSLYNKEAEDKEEEEHNSVFFASDIKDAKY